MVKASDAGDVGAGDFTIKSKDLKVGDCVINDKGMRLFITYAHEPYLNNQKEKCSRWECADYFTDRSDELNNSRTDHFDEMIQSIDPEQEWPALKVEHEEGYNFEGIRKEDDALKRGGQAILINPKNHKIQEGVVCPKEKLPFAEQLKKINDNNQMCPVRLTLIQGKWEITGVGSWNKFVTPTE